MNNMKTPFKAAFVVPHGAKKVLGESGWEFDSQECLPASIRNSLVTAFKLQPLQSYLGIESFGNEKMKMSVIYDDSHGIENIYFQLHGDGIMALVDYFNSCGLGGGCELFIPDNS
jgi:hypothetical protein